MNTLKPFWAPMRRLFVVLVAMLAPAAWVGAAPSLPAYKLDLSQTTVSGISSGAFMAVQFGVAHSATVSGVAATAGGPYFCAGKDSWAGSAVGKAIARCMQGDPASPALPITAGDLSNMKASARAWAGRGLIDGVDNLARQRVWLFHGYNDGVVKQPVNDALQAWYGDFVPATQLFNKDTLRAAHAQISTSCAASSTATTAANCNACAQTGGTFINACPSGDAGSPLYDAAGAALQLFYGPLTRTASAELRGRVLEFDQTPYVQRDGKPLSPVRAAMADSGYLYVPAACAAGEPCRLHIAFHGCQQHAGKIGQTFVTGAGFNEWADANHIVVLYPQATNTLPIPLLPSRPLNPQGCWDWWGYNDFGYDMAGHYATRDGAQIAAVWRMVEQLAGGGGVSVKAAADAAPQARVIDASAKQVALAWTPVAGAAGYRIYRGMGATGALQAASATAVVAPSFVDGGLAPKTAYRYVVRAVNAAGEEGAASAVVEARTAATPPACDPYFSLMKDRPVDAQNRPTNAVCP